MRSYEIASIAGDGIGREVMPPAHAAMAALGRRHGFSIRFHDLDWSSDYYFAHGRMMPVDAIDQLRKFHAILLGAVGHPDLPDHVTLNGLLLPIRRAFDQYANVRPAVLYEGVESPLRGKAPLSIDMMVVRENTEGEYAQVGGFVHPQHPAEVAIQTSVFTRQGCERIIRFAFELARKRAGRKRVASITKSNAQGFSMVLWDRCFRAVAEHYPEIETESLLVDAAAMNFVRRPESFDVVVASNLFGDILSDVSAIVSGSIGLAASANLDPERRYPSMFEPVHGSAPDIAGRGLANPLAMLLSAGMMLDHLGEAKAAAELEAAVRGVLAEGRVLTADLGGKASTAEVSAAVLTRIS